MTVYLFLAFYLFIVQAVYGGRSRFKEVLFCTIGFVLVLSLRSPYNGCDLVGGSETVGDSYYAYFRLMPTYSFSEIIGIRTDVHFELGFMILTKLITMMTNDFQVYMSIIAILQFIPISYFVFKYSPKITFSFFIFGCLTFFSFYCSGLRQALAISIGLLAIDQIIQGRWKWFVLIVLFDITIHTSAIFMFLLLPVYKYKLSVLGSSLGILMVLLLLPVIQSILMWFSYALLEGKYSGYLQEEGSAALTMFFIYIFFLLVSHIYQRESEVLSIIRWCVLFGLFFQSFGFINNSAITRGGYFFLVCLTILLPYTLLSFKKKKEQLFLLYATEIMFCIFFALTANGPRNIVPYYFFWEKPL